ncbi:MAG: ribosome biogenesis GTPase Der [Elusimicrobia bacterium]|nr:ribosome biogenesis GTPase Der [Elusimicrobiota bacterium]
MSSTLPTVVIVGRPNVGKSTLFNRLCESRRAITSPIAGTTRDWIEGLCHWNGRVYRVVDTGGYAPGADVMASVRTQVKRWVDQADVIVWAVDAKEGLTAGDQDFARLLRPMAGRVILAVNKADAERHDAALGDFARLGFSNILTLSASHGRRISSLLDTLEEKTGGPPRGGEPHDADTEEVRISIVGRPNVGKSSLTNRLVGEERMIVSPVPGTTRDTIDSRLRWKDQSFLLIDTAGLRAKKSKADDLEGLTRLMTERALERCEVALLLVDASEGLTEGDVAVGRLIDEKRRACVVGVNKWDLVVDRAPNAAYFRDRTPEGMPFMAHSPVVFLSAKTGHHVEELLKALRVTRDAFRQRFDEEELTAFFWKAVQERPYSYRGRKMVFYSATQAATAPPVFILRSNLEPGEVHFSFERHLEGVFRKVYGMAGVPLVMKFKKGKR